MFLKRSSANDSESLLPPSVEPQTQSDWDTATNCSALTSAEFDKTAVVSSPRHSSDVTFEKNPLEEEEFRHEDKEVAHDDECLTSSESNDEDSQAGIGSSHDDGDNESVSSETNDHHDLCSANSLCPPSPLTPTTDEEGNIRTEVTSMELSHPQSSSLSHLCRDRKSVV